MIHFCEAVVQEILSAYDQREVDEIIRNSVYQHRESKSGNDSMFIINMIVMLRTASIDTKSGTEHSNVIRAIELFRKFQQEGAKLF